MTRSEFIRDVNTFEDLRSFAYNNELDIAYDLIIGSDELDDAINDDLSYCDYDWRDLRDYLNDIDSSSDYYYKESYLEYSPLIDRDFPNYKADILNDMDAQGWPEDDEEEDEEESRDICDEAIEEEPFEGSDFDLDGMLRSYNADFQSIKNSI